MLRRKASTSAKLALATGRCGNDKRDNAEGLSGSELGSGAELERLGLGKRSEKSKVTQQPQMNASECVSSLLERGRRNGISHCPIPGCKENDSLLMCSTCTSKLQIAAVD